MVFMTDSLSAKLCALIVTKSATCCPSMSTIRSTCPLWISAANWPAGAMVSSRSIRRSASPAMLLILFSLFAPPMIMLLRQHSEKFKSHFDGPLDDSVAVCCRRASRVAHIPRAPDPAVVEGAGERDLCLIERKFLRCYLLKRPAVDISGAEIHVITSSRCHYQRGLDLVTVRSEVEAFDILDKGRSTCPPFQNADLGAGLLPDLKGRNMEDRRVRSVSVHEDKTTKSRSRQFDPDVPVQVDQQLRV